MVTASTSKLIKSASRWCFPLAIVVLLSGNLRFTSSRSASITDYWRIKVPSDSSDTNSLKKLNPERQGGRSKLREDQKKFFLIPTQEVTDWILGNHSQAAFDFYERTLNEDRAELWLYRAYQNHPQRILSPDEADFFIICGCLHFHYHLNRKGNSLISPKAFANEVLMSRIYDKTKPHLLAIPTTNPATSRHIGVKALVKALTNGRVENLWSLGFERNKWWQGLPPDRIIPIPYVITLPESTVGGLNPALGERDEDLQNSDNYNRTEGFVFYAGDRRAHAMEWSGCDRTMINPLMQEPNTDIRLTYNKRQSKQISHSYNATARLSQQEYNHRMQTSEFCLILCGDSPTSRSLTSAMVYGCIPLQVGSRWRGKCEPPCREGWGWTVSGTNNPHLPFSDRISWDLFPEMNEELFTKDPVSILRETLAATEREHRDTLRRAMRDYREAFIYGWGNPFDASHLGQAGNYALESLLVELERMLVVEH